MTEQQSQKIKDITGFTFTEILKMSENKFWLEFMRLKFNRTITPQQFDWFIKKRTEGLDPQTRDALDVFNGHLT